MGTDDESLFSITTAVEDVKNTFMRQVDRVEMGREIAKTFLGSVSVIVSVLGAFTAYRDATIQNTLFHNLLFILTGILFIVLIIVCIKLLLPAKFLGPVNATIECYQKEILGKNEKDTLLKYLSSYLNVIEINEKVIKDRNVSATIAGVLMIFIVACMVSFIIVK